MKRISVVVAAGLLLLTVAGNAAVRVTGEGDSKMFDPTDFSPDMKAKYTVMKSKCVRCHSLERVVEAITTGVAPISGQPFDRAAIKAYGAKMSRKRNSHMTKEEIVATVDLMNYLLEKAAK